MLRSAAIARWYEPLYRTRLELVREGDAFRLYFSPIGSDFEPVDAGDGDDVLVSWANPRFLQIRDLALGQSAHLGHIRWTLASKTTLGREHLGALYDLLVSGGDFKDSLFAVVRFEGPIPIAILADPAAKVVPEHDEDLLVAPPEVELRKTTRLTLGTVVKSKDGRAVEIPFALDKRQWEAMSRYAGEGTLLLTGPPGTGKTTVALLRATALIHSIFEYDDNNKRRSDVPTVDLRKSRFRVVVVTEHLRNYLKDFLSSPELGLSEVEVVNLRGSFLETFVRHKTLATWINGLRYRLNSARFKVSDQLTYIKSLQYTLRLCFYHAVLNARENAGSDCQEVIERINTGIYDALERIALERVLEPKERKDMRTQEQEAGFDLDEFLKRLRKDRAFNEFFNPRYDTAQRGLTELRSFLRGWFTKVESRAVDGLGADDEHWLLPGADDLLLSRFVEEVPTIERSTGLRNLFVRETWRELVHLVDPKEVLLRVIDDFNKTNDMQFLAEAGISRDDAVSALREWKATLEGNAGGADADKEDEAATIEDLDNIDGAPSGRHNGYLTRSDFPLLAAIARVFLATPPEAKEFTDKYEGVGFLLPDELPRYDHIIIDEGQDFTYAEIHLVRSLVEDKRQAVTISGDPFQRMDWRSGFSSLESIRIPSERCFSITRNYRQTIELTDWLKRLSRGLFGAHGPNIESAHESGPVPSIAIVPNINEVLNTAAQSISDWYELDQNPFTAILLIGFPTGIKNRITNSIADRLEANAIHVEAVADGRMIERGRVSVADVPTVKGLEFDCVVVIVSKDACALLEQSTPEATIARNMVYVACSRSKRNLHVILQKEVESLREGLLRRQRVDQRLEEDRHQAQA